MEIGYFSLWLILTLDALNTFLVITSIGLGIAGFVFLVMWLIYNDYSSYDSQSKIEHKTTTKAIAVKWYKKALIGFIISALLLVVIPTTKQAALILTVPNVLASEQIQELNETSKLLLKLTNQQLRSLLGEETSKTVEKVVEATQDGEKK